jgi:hypothetical protein
LNHSSLFTISFFPIHNFVFPFSVNLPPFVITFSICFLFHFSSILLIRERDFLWFYYTSIEGDYESHLF